MKIPLAAAACWQIIGTRKGDDVEILRPVDAAEHEVKYLLMCLRKPLSVSVHAFLRRLVKLNHKVRILRSAKDKEESHDDPEICWAQPLDNIQLCHVVMDVVPVAVKDAHWANRGDYKHMWFQMLEDVNYGIISQF